MPQHYSQTMRAFAAERPRRAMLAWLVSGILAVTWLVWFIAADVTVRAASEHARLEVAVAPSGIDTMVAGEVVSNGLVLGRDVKKGDILLEIDARREVLLLQQEKAHLAAAQAKKNALAAEITTRRDALHDAQAAAVDGLDAARSRAREAHAVAALAADDESRIRTLAAKGVAPQVGVKKAAAEHQKQEAAAAALDADIRKIDGEAKAEANAALADIERLNVEASELAGEIATAGSTIERLSLEITRHVLRAPVDGRLADVASLHAGSYVNEGQRLALVVPQGRVQVIADFAPSPVLGRVHPGQRAELHLDGFPWSQYGVLSATVRRVDSEVHDRLIRVELDLDAADASRPIVQHGFASLLSGLRAPDSGLLLLNGLDRHTLGAAWHRLATSAPQFHENHIFSGPLAYNLLMGRSWPAKPEDLAEARATCEELGLGPLLDRMPAGLMQQVGEGGWQLSHGEKSRIFLARALLQGAALTILDESFAALDPETLKRSVDCAARRAQTLLVVAHP